MRNHLYIHWKMRALYAGVVFAVQLALTTAWPQPNEEIVSEVLQYLDHARMNAEYGQLYIVT